MKRLWTVIFVAALLLSVTGAFAAKWTLMVYMDAENNGLHSAGIDDINEMEWCTDNSQVNIIVLFDGDGSSDQTIYRIWGDDGVYNGTIVSPTVDDGGAVIPVGGEADMSDWHTFDDFVDWTIDTFPADNYLVDLWDHGDGIFREGGEPSTGLFKGFCGGMKLWEIDDVLEDAAAEIGHDIGVVGFDACLMGQIESGYQLKDAASYVIGSEETEPLDGWDYFGFEIVCSNPNTPPADLAAEIVNEYLDSDGGNPYPGDTQAAQDLLYFDTDLASYFDDLCYELFMNCYDYKPDITAARNAAWSSSSNPNCKDLYEFASGLADDADLPASLRDAADAFCTAWETFIIAGGLHVPSDDASGATIYFPTNGSSDSNWNTYMNNITFTETQWDEFLEMYADPYYPYANYFFFDSYVVDDSTGGDGDGVPEPGEQVNITVTVVNEGYADAAGVTGTITTDGELTIDVGTADFGTIAASGGTGEGTFTTTVNSSCPEPAFPGIDLAMHSSDVRFDQDLDFTFTVGRGLEDDVEGDSESIWTHYGDKDMWHVGTYRSHSPSHSWKCGGEGDAGYLNGMDCSLKSPTVYVPTGTTEFTFWTCYWVQEGTGDKCWVEISTNGDDWDALGDYFNGTEPEWIAKTYDLTDYSGQRVFIRFRLDTNSSGTDEGWYVDDISVSGDIQTGDEGLVVYDFTAAPRGDGLMVSWSADKEEGVLGYDLYRRVVNDGSDGFSAISGVSGNRSITDESAGYVKVNDELIKGDGEYRYFDENLEPGKMYRYVLEAVYENVNVAVGDTTGEVGLPKAFALSQNRPNPFSTTSIVSFAVPKPARVEMAIYDLAGRKVAEVVDNYFEPGTYDVPISAEDFGSGIYFLRMTAAGEYTAVKKLIVTR
jgi:hypothetical protein